MNGRRRDVEPGLMEPGDYGRWEGLWYAVPPGTDLIGSLGDGVSHHRVIEHEDGTITASPSIVIRRGKPHEWHGFLERGVWRKA